MSVSNDDDIVSLYNGSIYPMFKYDSEKTSGYSVESGVDINPVSGNLMTVENDLSLKGINGLDLNLNRVYSSGEANMFDAAAKLSDDSQYRKIGYYRVNAAAEITITYRESAANGGINPGRKMLGYLRGFERKCKVYIWRSKTNM